MEHFENHVFALWPCPLSSHRGALVYTCFSVLPGVSEVLFHSRAFPTLPDKTRWTVPAAVGLYSGLAVGIVSVERVPNAGNNAQPPLSLGATPTAQGVDVSYIMGGMGIPVFLRFQL